MVDIMDKVAISSHAASVMLEESVEKWSLHVLDCDLELCVSWLGSKLGIDSL